MRIANKEVIKYLREKYPKGTRVELVRMEDDFAPPTGTIGVVQGVDAIGSILVDWSNGSSLSVVYGVDFCRKLDKSKNVRRR